jgi:excisionase family DNA binding protein
MNDLLDQFASLVAEKVTANLRTLPASPPIKLYTLSQVSEMIGRSKAAVQHLVARGELPSVKSGRRVHIAAEDLDQWIRQNKS